MAYVSQENKKKLAPKIKEILKKYNMKGSLSIRHHSSLVLTLTSGELDIIGAFNDHIRQDHNDNKENRYRDDYLQVNEYWIEETYANAPRVKNFLQEILAAMKGPDYVCEDDPMTDYFFRSHYTDINVGRWDKPFVLTQPIQEAA